MSWSPTVSVLMPAYDAEAFVAEAILSALGQEDYPADAVEVVVVDDGSRDRTAAVVQALADRHPGRVRLVHQANRGLVGAVNAAAAHARGELLALLDADDAWPADKLRRQVDVLAARPEVGLVYTDMCVIDAEGLVLDPSWLAGSTPPEGRDVGRLLEQNFVTASGVVLRADLAAELFPIPAELPWADWWLGVRAAQLSQVAYLSEPKALYRFHGANMSLGSTGPTRLRELRKSLSLQRWFLRRMQTPQTRVEDLERAWDAFVTLATEALEVAGSPFARLVEVDEAERLDAVHGAEEARALLAAGARHDALGAAVRAAATDPSCEAARGALLEVRAQLPDGLGQQPLAGAQAVVVGVPADELVRDEALLGACARALDGVRGVTLAIDASTHDPREAAARIRELAAAHGLDGDDGLDLALVTGPLDELGRARLAHGLSARVGARALDDGLPCFGAGQLDALRAFVLAQR